MCFLFVDRIVATTPGKLIRGVKHVTWDDTYLTTDPDGRTCFSPSHIGETLGQLAAWNVMSYYDFSLRPVAGIVSSTRLLRSVYPGETLLLESVIDDLDETAVRYHGIAKVGQEPVFIIDSAIGPLLPMSTFIDPLVVRRQFDEINRPGDWDKWFEEKIIYTPSTQRAGTASATQSMDHFPCSMQFDKVKELEPGTHWIAEKLVSRTAPYFPDHFPNNPVLPMTVLLECKLNLASQFVEALIKQSNAHSRYKITELRKIKMNEFVHPGDVVVTHLKLKHQDNNELILSCQSFVDEKRICIVEIVMSTVNS